MSYVFCAAHSLQGRPDLCILRNETAWAASFQFPYSCIWERFIYSLDLSTYFAAAKYADRLNFRNKSLTSQLLTLLQS